MNAVPTPGTAGDDPRPAPRRLARSRDDRWIGGVCGGIADYFGWDPALVRLVFAVSIVLPGPQVLAYLLLWLIMPKAR
ncbi:PspC domain-containing protein [Gordonia sp. VNK21]|uniref:PspC domain-containing protein n=1 Tax=Gordonia sp. VNK21 TaxID=3382483 RepID=UPI0038D3FEB2